MRIQHRRMMIFGLAMFTGLSVFALAMGGTPDVVGKVMPALALAKGLGKSESDGSLSWVVELDNDRSMKVNGIPFGKAPN